MPNEVIRTSIPPPEGLEYRLGKEFVFGAETECKAWEDENGRFIEGYASTKMVDSYDEIVEPSAFESTKEEFFKYGGPMLYGHGAWEGLAAVPVGKILPDFWTIDNIGLRVRAQIAETTQGNDVWELIKLGVLKSFSIGFRVKKYEMDEEAKPPVRTITDLRLYEISIVTIPANPETLFEVVGEKGFKPQSLEFKSLLNNHGKEQGGSQAKSVRKERKTMPNTNSTESAELAKLASTVADHDTALDKVSGLQSDIDAMKKDLNEGITAITDKQKQFLEGAATKAEVDALGDKLATDLSNTVKQLNDDMGQVRNAAEMAKRKGSADASIAGWRQLLPENSGKSDLEVLLHADVDYNKVPSGDVIKAIHDLHDAQLILHAYSKHRDRFKSGAEVQKDMNHIQESLVKLIGYYDPNIDTKAFSTGTSSYGSDWALTVPSPQMFDLYDLNRGLEAEFTHYTLKGKTDTYPLKTSHGHAWSADTAASNNPDRYKKTDITTSTVVFTAGKMTYDVVADEEGIEGDSIVQVVPILRQEIAFGLADGMEDALVNGDNTATHQDTGLTATDMYTRDRFMGLRWKAGADSKTFDTQNTSATVGDGTTAFTAKDVRYLRILAAKMGVKPSEFRYVVPINVYFKMLNMTEFSQPGTYGSGASWLTGYLNNADGIPLIISEHMWDNMNTSGVYDNSTKTHSGILGFNKTGFVVGDRRLMMIEFEKDIHTGQWSFVGSIRKDFQKVVASTLYPVAYGYKITT